MANSTEQKRVATTRPEHRRGMTRSQIRNERRQRSDSRKKRKRAIYITSGTFLAVIFILSLTVGPGLANTIRGETNTPQGLNTGGPVPLDPDDGTDHIETNTPGSGYSTRPATSGPHWFDSQTSAGTSAPADWGIYENPLPDEVLIHNLEHGGVGLHYNCPDGCDDVVAALKSVAPRTQFILSPYPDMESKIAITGWRHHLFMETFDRAAIVEFIDAYLDRAPESVPFDQF